MIPLQLLDAEIRLYPAPKQSMNIDFETSRNVGDALTTGHFLVLVSWLGYATGMHFVKAYRPSTNVSFGIELGTSIISNSSNDVSHNILFRE